MDLILWRHAEAEDGSPDSARKLTARGREQARRIAAWLKPRLPRRCEVLVSPAIRAQQTALALGVPFVTSPAVGTEAAAAALIAAVDWPARSRATLIVGHQPTVERPVAQEEPEPPGGEVIAVRGGKSAAHVGDSESVPRSTECPAFDRYASGERSIDLGESVSLGLAVGPARPAEQAHARGDFLLEIDPEPALDALGRAHGVYIGRPARLSREIQGVLIARHSRDVAEGEKTHLARAFGQSVCALDLDLVAVVLEDPGVQRELIRLLRLDEAAGPQPPVVVKILERQSPGVAARVRREIVCAVRHERPVQKLGSRVVAEGVVVEDVEHRQISGGRDQAPPVDAAGELVRIRLHFFAAAAEAPGLARKQAGSIES